MQLWILFTQTKQFRVRPSEQVGINPETDPYTAYCFDEAVFMWGRHVEGELRSAQKGAKTDKQAAMKVEMRFRTLMQEENEDGAVEDSDEHKDFPKHLQRTPAPTRFRDPMTALKK